MRLNKKLTAPVRMLPQFLIIGAQKCGTSSLYNYMVQHTCVAPAAVKEVHFFDLNYHRGLIWYRSHFPTVFRKFRNSEKCAAKLITGEATPYYLFHPLVPRRVKGDLPGVKLIVLLRNPVDRAYSQYHHVLRKGSEFETLTFAEAIEADAERLRGETQKMLADETYNSLSHQHHSYVAKGIYVDQLQMWSSYFAAEQMLVMAAEELYSHPASVLTRVFEFLELPDQDIPDLSVRNPGAYRDMDAEVRSRLVEFDRPHNARLYEFLKMKFDWDD